jgi:hypothetical protein
MLINNFVPPSLWVETTCPNALASIDMRSTQKHYNFCELFSKAFICLNLKKKGMGKPVMWSIAGWATGSPLHDVEGISFFCSLPDPEILWTPLIYKRDLSTGILLSLPLHFEAVMILDITHRPVFYLKQIVSETRGAYSVGSNRWSQFLSPFVRRHRD